MKKTIRLNERELHSLIMESVKKVLKENGKVTFREGDNVIVHSKKGDFEGVIKDWNYSIATFEPSYDVEYTINGVTKTMICVPESAIESVPLNIS